MKKTILSTHFFAFVLVSLAVTLGCGHKQGTKETPQPEENTVTATLSLPISALPSSLQGMTLEVEASLQLEGSSDSPTVTALTLNNDQYTAQVTLPEGVYLVTISIYRSDSSQTFRIKHIRTLLYSITTRMPLSEASAGSSISLDIDASDWTPSKDAPGGTASPNPTPGTPSPQTPPPPLQRDQDRDSVVDAEDNCPSIANRDQADLDRDGQGDVCDEDIDGDTLANATDGTPFCHTNLTYNGDLIGGQEVLDNLVRPEGEDPYCAINGFLVLDERFSEVPFTLTTLTGPITEIRYATFLSIGQNITLERIVLPNLLSLDKLCVADNQVLRFVEFSALTQINCQEEPAIQMILTGNPQLTEARYPALETSGCELFVRNNPLLATLDLSSLQTITGIFIQEAGPNGSDEEISIDFRENPSLDLRPLFPALETIAGGAHFQEGLEPNNTRATAFDITPFTRTGAPIFGLSLANAADTDFYSFTVEIPFNGGVFYGFPQDAVGDFEIRILDQQGQSLGTAVPFGNEDGLAIFAILFNEVGNELPAGTYFIEATGDPIEYALFVMPELEDLGE